MKFLLILLIIITFIACKKSTSGPDKNEEVITTWVKTDGLDSLTVNCLTKHNDNLFAGTNNGVFWSNDGSANWNPRKTGLTDNSIRTMDSNGNFLFVGTTNTGVFRSSNDGLTWEISNNGISNNRILSLVAMSNYIFAGTLNHGLYRSGDQGSNWQLSSNGIPINSIRSLVKCDSGLFAGTKNGEIYRSTDFGSTWNSISIPNANGWVTSIHIDGSTILASTESSASNVYLSIDLGNYWQDADSGMSSPGVYAFEDNQNMIFAGTHWGFYFSTDHGTSWKEASHGLPNKTIYTLYVESPFVFAGGFGNGVWRRDLSQIVPDE